MRHEWEHEGVEFHVEHALGKPRLYGEYGAGPEIAFAACAAEILRLAGFKDTLEKVALAAGCLPTQFSDAYGHVLERVESLAERIKELESAVEISQGRVHLADDRLAALAITERGHNKGDISDSAYARLVSALSPNGEGMDSAERIAALEEENKALKEKLLGARKETP